MTKVGLASIITPEFLKSFSAVASTKSDPAKAFQGQNATSVDLSEGLRIGARAFSTAVQGLNSLLGGLNLTEDSLEDLLKLTDEMIQLAERATRSGSSVSSSLQGRFERLGKKFRDILSDTKLGDYLLMDSEELAEIFAKVGLNPKESEVIADVFKRLVLVEDLLINGSSAKVPIDGKQTNVDKFLAAETIRGSRPYVPPPSAFVQKIPGGGEDLGPIRQVSNEEAVAAGVATGYSIYQADDGSGNQTVFIESVDGSVTNSVAVTTDAELKAVNQQKGFSVIQSTEDFLGHNAGGFNQLFLVDTQGAVVHQFTANTGTEIYGTVDISEDNLTIAYADKQAAGEKLVTITADSIGANPATRDQTTIETLAAGRLVTKVQISDDGTHAGFVEENGADRTVHLHDLINELVDEDLLANTGDANFQFLDATRIVISRSLGAGNFDLIERRIKIVEGEPVGSGDLIKVSDNDAQAGGIATDYNVYQADNGSGLQTIYVETADGQTVNMLTVTADATFKAINEHTGYSVIESTEDFLGTNTNNYSQLFLVDTNGDVVHQYTDNDGTHVYGSVDISEDSLKIAFSRTDSTSNKVIVLEAGSIGQNPAMATTLWDETVVVSTQVNQVKISDDGNYLAFGKEYFGDNSVALRDIANSEYDSSLETRTDITDFGFLDNGKLAIVKDEGNGESDVILHTFTSGDGTFGAATTFAAGTNVNSVAAADLNGDGILDLVSGISGGVSVMLGVGDGTFGPRATYAEGGGKVLTDDFNGDGIVDLVALSPSTDTIHIRLGAGDGTFGASTSYAVGDDPRDADTVDFNGDGITDLFSVNSDSSVSVLLGVGDGTFLTAVSYATAALTISGLAADFDGDNALDLLIGVGLNQQRMLLGNGDGTFNASTAVGKSNTIAMATADLNGDGILDVVSLGQSLFNPFYEDEVFIQLGVGDGTFGTVTSFVVGGGLGSITLADIDGDGTQDILASDRLGHAVFIATGVGNGTFNTATSMSLGTTDPRFITTGDFNGDGVTDIVTANASNSVSIFLGNGTTMGGASSDVLLLDNENINLFETVQTSGVKEGYFAYHDSSTNELQIYDDQGNHERDYEFSPGDSLDYISLAQGQTTGASAGLLGTIPSVDGDNDDELYRLDSNDGGSSSDPLEKITDNDIQSGFTADGFYIYQADNGSGFQTVFFETDDGITTTSLTVTANVTLKAVNEHTGYALIESTEDFLGTNTNNYSQLFLVDTNGDVVHQYTDNDGSQTYGSASITADNLKIAVARTEGDDQLQTITAASLGQAPNLATVETVFTIGDGGNATKVRISDDGTFAGFVKELSGDYSINFFDLQNGTVDRVLQDETGDVDFAFLDSGRIVIQRKDGANYDIVEHYHAAGNGSFTGIITYANSGEFAGAMGDFNNDGIIDVVFDDRMQIGVGDGTFIELPSILNVGGEAFAIDLNHDGNLDIISKDTWFAGTYISYYEGRGDGTFESVVSTHYATLTDANDDFHISDFDGDGEYDYLFSGNGYINVGLGSGDGSFAAPYSLAAFSGTTLSTIKDFDNDGNLDIVNVGSHIAFYQGNGDGTFAAGVTYAGTSTSSIGAGDIDGDGNIDLITGYSNRIRVRLGNGDGTFTTAISYAFGANTGIGPMFIDDFDADGQLDILTSSGISGGSFAIATGNGDGTFNAAVSYSGNSKRFGDLNGDGIWDVVGGEYTDGLRITFGQGTIYDSPAANNTVLVDDESVSSLAALQSDVDSRGYFAYLDTGSDTFKLYDELNNLQDTYTFGSSDTIETISLARGEDDYRLNIGLHGTISSYDGDLDQELYKLNLYATPGGGGTNDLGPLTQISNQNVTYGGISQRNNIYQATINGKQAIIVEDLDGNIIAQLTSPTDILLKAVDEETGYSVIESKNNYLGFNASGRSQLFLLDNLGNVIHQYTDNGGSETYGSVDISRDPRVIAYGRTDGDDKLVVLRSEMLGTNPSSWSPETIYTLGAGKDITKVKINDEGSMAGFVENDGSTSMVRLLGVHPTPRVSDLIEGVDFGFIDSQEVAVVVENGANHDIIKHKIAPAFATTESATTPLDMDSIALADFDGDGNLDLVGVEHASSQIGIKFGNGDGTFAATQTITSASINWRDGQAKDVDNDGNIDVIAIDKTNNKVHVLLGDGNGSFAAAMTSAVTTQNFNYVLGDINGDDVLDLVLAKTATNYNYGIDDYVNVHLGNGDGTFGAATSLAASGDGNKVKLGDFNGDGNLDIVTASDVNGIRLGNGNGTFAAETTFAGTGNENTVLAVGDLNGDSILDFVTGFYDELRIQLGAGNGTFGAAVSYQIGSSVEARNIEIGDFDGDGKNDVLVNLNYLGPYSLILMSGDGEGGISSTSGFNGGNSDPSMAVGDLDGDGKLDVVQAASNKVFINMARSLETPFMTNIDIGAFSTVQAGLGRAGFIALEDKTTNDVKVYDEAGTLLETSDLGAVDTVTSLNIIRNLAGGPEVGIIGTIRGLNGDVDNELYRLGAGNIGTGTFQAGITIGPALTGNQPAIFGDLNGDGNLDFIAKDKTVYLGNGDGTFNVSQTNISAESVFKALADLNNDGYLDLLSRGSLTDPATITWGNGDGTFGTSNTYSTADDAGLFDINADGLLDLVTKRNTGIFVRLNNGDGTFGLATSSPIAATIGAQFAIADFDHDGDADILLESTFYLGGGSNFSDWGPSGLNLPTNLDPFYFHDLNNDGNHDLVQYINANRVNIQMGNGDGTFNTAVSHSISGFYALGDVNGDGEVDLIGNQIALGNGDGTFAASYSVGFTKVRGVGDFNNDGVTDIYASDGVSDSIYLGNSTPATRYSGSEGTGPGDPGDPPDPPDPEDIIEGEEDTIISSIRAGELVAVEKGTARSAFIAVENTALDRVVIYDEEAEIIDTIQLKSTDIITDLSIARNFAGGAEIGILGTINGVSQDADTELYRVAGVNKGQGTFGSTTSFDNIGGIHNTPALGDLNFDGNLDLVSTDISNGTLRVQLGNGDGSFGAATTYATAGAEPINVNLADFDGDGDLDVAVMIGGESVQIFENDGAGVLTAGSNNALLTSFSSNLSLLSGDVNNDGKVDLVAGAGNDPSAPISLFLSNGDGTFAEALTVTGTGGSPSYVSQLADLNNDGILDILGNDQLIIGNGDGSFQAAVTLGVGSEVKAADFNLDGNLDVIGAQAGGGLTMRLGNGNGTFGAVTTITTGTVATHIDFHDINGDGIVDIIHSSDTGDVVGITRGNGDGTFQGTTTFAIGISDQNRGFALADINGDGVNDLVTDIGAVLGSKRANVVAADRISTPSERRLSSKSREYDSIFSTDRKLSNRPDAYRLLHDLKELRKQIVENRKVLKDAFKVLNDNIELMRSAGFAFLNVGNQLTGNEDAEQVASLIRREMSNASPKALNQAHNLTPAAVAALLTEDPSFKNKGS